MSCLDVAVSCLGVGAGAVAGDALVLQELWQVGDLYLLDVLSGELDVVVRGLVGGTFTNWKNSFFKDAKIHMINNVEVCYTTLNLRLEWTGH